MLAGGCKRWQLSSGISTYCASKEDDASVNKLFMQLYLFSQLGVTSPRLPLSALQPMVTWALSQYCVTEALSSTLIIAATAGLGLYCSSNGSGLCAAPIHVSASVNPQVSNDLHVGAAKHTFRMSAYRWA